MMQIIIATAREIVREATVEVDVLPTIIQGSKYSNKYADSNAGIKPLVVFFKSRRYFRTYAEKNIKTDYDL